MEILEKLFGNIGKVKIMKLFIFNPNSYFDLVGASAKTKIKKTQIKKDISILEKVGVIRGRDIKNEKGKKVKAWHLNTSFEYLSVFKDFFIGVSPFSDNEIISKFSKAGRLKVVAVSGVFINNDESQVDLLIAGDRLKRSVLNRVIKEIEAGIGKEIKYAILDTGDFAYRLGVRDKLIRDIFDYPHNLILDKVGVQV